MRGPYTARPAISRLPGERIPPWLCACPDRKPWHRHREPWECVSDEEVAAWRARHPTATCREGSARGLAWLAREFGG